MYNNPTDCLFTGPNTNKAVLHRLEARYETITKPKTKNNDDQTHILPFRVSHLIVVSNGYFSVLGYIIFATNDYKMDDCISG